MPSKVIDSLHTLCYRARNIGILLLELAVSAENGPAMRFYKRHDFIVIGRISNALRDHAGSRGNIHAAGRAKRPTITLPPATPLSDDPPA